MHGVGFRRMLCGCAGVVWLVLGMPAADAQTTLSPEQIIAALRNPNSSSGDIADAVEEATGARGFMYHDMKPIFKAKIISRAATALLGPLEGAVIEGARCPVRPPASVFPCLAVPSAPPLRSVERGDYIVGDLDGVAVVPEAAAQRVDELIAEYDAKESKMLPIIEREKSMLKALEIYNRN